jgi:hypothetical protein
MKALNAIASIHPLFLFLFTMCNFQNAEENIIAELLFDAQSLESLQDLDHWRALCPFLSISAAAEGSATDRSNPIGNHAASNDASGPQFSPRDKCSAYATRPRAQSLPLGAALRDRGYFRLPAGQMELPPDLCERMAVGVRRLVAHGYPATFVLMYDEPWLLGEITRAIMEPASGNSAIGDWYVFYVDPKHADSYTPGPPHRDRPLAGPSSFREASGDPMYCSIWLALTNATPENSCLYVLPREDDAGYHGEGDAVHGAITHPLQWQRIVAQPLAAGGMLAFSHRLLHWGSTPQPGAVLDTDEPGARPRIALTLAFADPSFEEPYFSAANLPFPPVGLRLGLVAGQQIQYEHLMPLDRHRIALFRRIFHSQRPHFSATYYDKITSAIQFLAYQKQQQRLCAQPRVSSQ